MSFKLYTQAEYLIDAFPPTIYHRLQWYLNHQDKEAFKKEYGISVYSFVKRFASFKYLEEDDYFYVKKIKLYPHLTWSSWA
tara:strand:- start:461 stop:703 length:243 start_codon:yes stop_codon:yes gene_type:complete